MKKSNSNPMLMKLAGAFVAATMVFPACTDDGVTFIPDEEDAGVDAGMDEPPPEPPVFPLKEGDEITIPTIGGATDPCNLGEGFCDRAMKATYTIEDVTLDEESQRWNIDAFFIYQLEKDTTSIESLSPLFISKAAPFDTLTMSGESSSGSATFTADAPFVDIIDLAEGTAFTPNNYPFFHFDPAYATQAGSAYSDASLAFIDRIKEIDAMAEIENQAAASKMEAYFVDNLGPDPYLHKLLIEYSRFGFVCKVTEKIVDYQEGMDRNDSSFGVNAVPLTNIPGTGVFLRRDGTRYRCSCFDGTCKDVSGSNCLSPVDPDAEPSEANCDL